MQRRCFGRQMTGYHWVVLIYTSFYMFFARGEGYRKAGIALEDLTYPFYCGLGGGWEGCFAVDLTPAHVYPSFWLKRSPKESELQNGQHLQRGEKWTLYIVGLTQNLLKSMTLAQCEKASTGVILVLQWTSERRPWDVQNNYNKLQKLIN